MTVPRTRLAFPMLVLSAVLLVLPLSTKAQPFPGFDSTALPTVTSDWGLKIVVFDVGQADAILLLTPWRLLPHRLRRDKRRRKQDRRLPAIAAKNGVGAITTMDLSYATHYDSDHVGGLRQVRERGIRIRKAYDQGPSKKRKLKTESGNMTVYGKYVAAIGDPDGDLAQGPGEPDFIRHKAHVGNVEHLGLDPQVEIHCVAACGDTAGDEHDLDLDPANPSVDDENPGSIALLVKLGEFEFYTAGDQTDDNWKDKPAVEDSILDADAIPGGPDIDLLKVSHHGSDTSNSPRFIKALDPEVAIVSSTHTHHGIPKRITLKTLQDNRVFVLITGDGKDPETGDYTQSSATPDDDPVAFTVNPAAVFNKQGDVTVLVSKDGNRYTVTGASFAKTFSAKDSDNQR